MDLLKILRARIEALPVGDYGTGLRAVLQHVEAAANHLRRGNEVPDETAFTDAIYRTNQAFEGSLKEAFRVLTKKDPLAVRPFDIERFFEDKELLRPRVLSQLSNYRKEWRNPSSHDYRLDFDEDEALLAIVSVCAFAIVLIDQIAERISFEAAKAVPQQIVASSTARQPLIDHVTEAIQRFHAISTPDTVLADVRESSINGSLAGYLTAALPEAKIQIEPTLGGVARPDLIIEAGDEKLLVEVKRMTRLAGLFGSVYRRQHVEQAAHYIAASGIKQALVYVHGGDPLVSLAKEEHKLPGIDARITMLAPPVPPRPPRSSTKTR